MNMITSRKTSTAAAPITAHQTKHVSTAGSLSKKTGEIISPLTYIHTQLDQPSLSLCPMEVWKSGGAILYCVVVIVSVWFVVTELPGESPIAESQNATGLQSLQSQFPENSSGLTRTRAQYRRPLVWDCVN